MERFAPFPQASPSAEELSQTELSFESLDSNASPGKRGRYLRLMYNWKANDEVEEHSLGSKLLHDHETSREENSLEELSDE